MNYIVFSTLLRSACKEAYENKEENDACSLGCKSQKPFAVDHLLKVSIRYMIIKVNLSFRISYVYSAYTHYLT